MEAIEQQLEQTTLTAEEIEAMARGLYAVALCDGLHERETALIASFLEDGRVGALADLARGPTMTPAELARTLTRPDTRTLFLKTALLLSWADGKVTEEEQTLLQGFAQALGAGEIEMNAMEEQVKEYLLSHLAHVQNTPAVAEVAKAMKLL